MNLDRLGLGTQARLSDEAVKKYISLAQTGDIQARDTVVKANLPLVMSVAKRFVSFGYELEDLFQIGCIGLVKAIERFDLQRGLKFSTYAVPLIIGEIRSFIRDDGPIKVSRGLKERYLKLSALRQKYLKENGTEPSLTYLAEQSGLTPEEVVATFDSGNKPVSLNEVVYSGEGNPVLRQDTIAVAQDELESVTEKVSLKKILDSLPQRERQILILKYLNNYSQSQIAERFGISQVHVSRLLKKAIAQVQEVIES